MKGLEQDKPPPRKVMEKDKSKRPEKREGPPEVESFEIPYAGEVTMPSSDKPPAAPPDKKIHRRRPLPPVDDCAPSDRHQPR
jgi:hypothetical protein